MFRGSSSRLGQGPAQRRGRPTAWRSFGPLLAFGIVVAGSLAIGGCRSLPELAATHEWLEISTPHFILRTELSRERSLEFVRRLELFRSAIHRLTGVPRLRNAPRARVYAFESARSFDPYRGYNRGLEGYFLPSAFAPYITFYGNAPGEKTHHILYHEYVHMLMSSARSNVPLWYEEGFAEILGTFRVEDGYAQVGRALTARLEELRYHSWRSSASILATSRYSPEYLGTRPSFHAQAWGLAHYFMFGSSERRQQLEDYLERWNRGEDPVAAFETSFGRTYTEVWGEVVEHLSGKLFAFGDFAIGDFASDFEPEVRRLSREEKLTVLGELLIQRGQVVEIGLASKLFREVLFTEPKRALPHAGISLAYDLSGRHGEANSHIEIALNQAPRDALVRLLAGDHFVRRALEHSQEGRSAAARGDVASLEKARSHYRMAFALESGSLGMLQRIGMTYLYDPENRSAGIAYLEQVFERNSHHLGLAETLARLHLQTGREAGKEGELEASERARAVLARALRAPAADDAVGAWLAEIEAAPGNSLGFDELRSRIGRRPEPEVSR